MNEDVMYVRQRLAEAKQERGEIARIVRAVEIDRRTLDSIQDASRIPQPATISRLRAYFKRAERRAKS